MERLWYHKREHDSDVIKTHIGHLRRKLARLPGGAAVITTVPGRGYMAASAAVEMLQHAS